MSKISIIVPVYMAERYLNRCINSVLAQSYENFELILINDGSPDNCGKICDEYAETDSRVKVIHKKNEGVSAARNAGLEVCNGEFIVFLDSDDRLDVNALEIMYSAQKESEADLVSASHISVKQWGKDKKRQFSGRFYGTEIYENLFQLYFKTVVVWGKLYKADIIKDNCLRFDTKMPYSEDTMFLLDYIEKSQSLFYINDIVYYYTSNYHSAITKFYPDMSEYVRKLFFKVKDMLEDSSIEEKKKKKHISLFANDFFVLLINHYVFFMKLGKELFNKISDEYIFYRRYFDFSIEEKPKKQISNRTLSLLAEKKYAKFVRIWKCRIFKKKLKNKIKMLLIKLKILY